MPKVVYFNHSETFLLRQNSVLSLLQLRLNSSMNCSVVTTYLYILESYLVIYSYYIQGLIFF